MALKTRPFDVAEMLETEEDIRMFLQVAAEEGTSQEFIHTLSTAARAVGMTEVAKRAGVTRASLYKSLADGGQPKFSTISISYRSTGLQTEGGVRAVTA